MRLAPSSLLFLSSSLGRRAPAAFVPQRTRLCGMSSNAAAAGEPGGSACPCVVPAEAPTAPEHVLGFWFGEAWLSDKARLRDDDYVNSLMPLWFGFVPGK